MKKIGITGQSGFIGTHLFNWLSLFKQKYELVPFEDSYFDEQDALNNFVSRCDVIVHLSAVNRHPNENELYRINNLLVDKLIKALKTNKRKVHLLFASSTQEERENAYGRSKKEGREKLAAWASENNSGFTGLVIPNVFGPFGKPYYNSVIATFCYQLCNGQQPNIEIDTELKLIYVNELVEQLEKIIEKNENTIKESFAVSHTSSIRVSGLLEKLNSYKSLYFENGIIPDLPNRFEINLFNTFRSYIDIEKYFPFKYKINKDDRGIFVELIKQNSGGQVSYSTTKPGITRGNHFHTRKIERFSVIKGKALITMRKYGTDQIIKFELNGDQPTFVDMPVWYTHNLTNIGEEELITVFYSNEIFNPEDPDTYYEKV